MPAGVAGSRGVDTERGVSVAVRIRLKRMGAKRQPFYRLVVADARSPRDGRFIAEVGYYDPTANPTVIKVEEDKVLEWLGKGAQPSETVKALLAKAGVMRKFQELRQGQRRCGGDESCAPS